MQWKRVLLRYYWVSSVALLCVIAIFTVSTLRTFGLDISWPVNSGKSEEYIKWVDFNASKAAMAKALEYDINSQNKPVKLNWIELLACLASKYGNDFKWYKQRDLDYFVTQLQDGIPIDIIAGSLHQYAYYYEAFQAVLGGFVGSYQIEIPDPNNPEQTLLEARYGLKVFSPIAKGFYYSHYDDFGNSRDYGFKRKHLGNDLLAGVGTPIVAVETGIVEAVGWNQYGGWRLGIRSLDGKRYYYYAHLRKDRPYHAEIKQGALVKAGDVIGYVGRTGYSAKENVNNIEKPHLHFGLQLIFHPSQKEGNQEIWIDVYELINFLEKNKSTVYRDEETKDYYRKYGFDDQIN